MNVIIKQGPFSAITTMALKKLLMHVFRKGVNDTHPFKYLLWSFFAK